MPPKTSILLPSIRPSNLSLYLKAAKKASQYNDLEIILVSPYLNFPEEVLKDPKVKFIHSYANPNICLMEAANSASGDFLYNNTDDGLLQENVIDIAIDIFERKLSETSILNMCYVEDALNADDLTLKKEPKPFHPNYWATWPNPDFQKPSIDPNWRIAPHFFMRREYFEKLGGLDIQYEYNNYSLHDLIFRAQYNGSKVYDFPITAFLCSHLPGQQGDHFAIDNCQSLRDKPKFDELYAKEDAISSRVFLDINDWKTKDKIWKERFPDPNNLPLYK